MQLAFDSEYLRSICENEAIAETGLGAEVARALKGRLADLVAATSVNDLPAGNPHMTEIGDTKCLVIGLPNDYQIICEANHTRNPLTASGNLDWDQVARIKVTRIGRDYDFQRRVST